MIAGVAVAIVTSPIDVVKTRVMNVDPHKPAYSGMIDCINKVGKVEGLMGFYKGFNAQWLRIGPLTTLQFIIWERLRKAFGISAI